MLPTCCRAATVTAVTASRVLSCTREVFDAHLGSLDEIRNLWRFEALRKVPLLAGLTAAQRLKLCAAFVPRVIAPGGAVISKGEEGEAFYVVERGACVATGDAGVVRCAALCMDALQDLLCCLPYELPPPPLPPPPPLLLRPVLIAPPRF